MVRRVSIFVLMLVMGLTACGPEIQPLIPGAVPWADGEQSIYAVTDIEGNAAGTATVTLDAGATSIEEAGWTLRREIATQGDQEVVVVEVTEKGLRPRLATLVRLLGTARQQVITTYNGGQVDMELTTARDVTTYERRNITSDARDQRTLLAFVRMLPLAEGYATQLNSYLPVADRFERVTVIVLGQETVSVAAGSYESWHVVLRVDERETEAWIAMEAPQALVKFIDGSNGATFELREYRSEQ